MTPRMLQYYYYAMSKEVASSFGCAVPRVSKQWHAYACHPRSFPWRFISGTNKDSSTLVGFYISSIPCMMDQWLTIHKTPLQQRHCYHAWWTNGWPSTKQPFIATVGYTLQIDVPLWLRLQFDRLQRTWPLKEISFAIDRSKLHI